MHAPEFVESRVTAPRELSVDDMTARYDRPVSLAATLARRIAFFSLALFAVAAVAHRFASLTIGHFLAVAAIAAGLAAIGLILAMVGLARLWAVGAKGGWSSFAALVAALLVIAPIAYDAWLFAVLPETSDVSSDPSDPPRWLMPPGGGDPPVAASTEGRDARQHDAYAGLVGRRYEGAIDRVLQAVRMAMADADLKIVSETGADALAPTPGPGSRRTAQPADPGGLSVVPIPLDRPSPILLDTPAQPKIVRIQAIHRTPIFGLTSDVLIRLREDDESTVADMRVASRFGPHDLGTGAALIRRFFASLDHDLLGISGRHTPTAGGD